MQDEIIKHTGKIYKTLKNEKQSAKHKLKEIIIEIFIIVFAVTLSIYLHSCSEHNHQQNEVSEFLIDLKSDLQNDIKAMNDETKDLQIVINSIEKLKELSPEEIKKIGKIQLDVHLTTRRTNEGNFEGFKSSGKIGFIENKELKKNILEYFIQNMPPLYKIEQDRNTKSMELLEEFSNTIDESLNTIIQKPKVRTIINLNSQYCNTLITAYKSDIELAEKIVAQIDLEIKK